MSYTYKRCIADAVSILRRNEALYVCGAIEHAVAIHYDFSEETSQAAEDEAYCAAEQHIAQFHRDCQISLRGRRQAWLTQRQPQPPLCNSTWRIEVLTLIHTEQYALLHEKLREHFANNPSDYYLGGNNYDE